MNRQLFIDLDGTIFDFDKRFKELSNHSPKEYEDKFGRKQFWDIINKKDPDFFLNLDLLEDAHILLDAIDHLDFIFLTGVHSCDINQDRHREHKVASVRKHFPGRRVITCQSKKKSLFMKAGDVIVDDFLKYRHLWEAKGGHWIHHISAEQSVKELRALEIIS